MGIRLFDGAIHQVPKDASAFHRVAFRTYDFWIPTPFRSAKDKAKRKSYEELLEKLQASDGKHAGTLRRLMEFHKEYGFSCEYFCVGSFGCTDWHCVETVRESRWLCYRCVSRDRILYAQCLGRISCDYKICYSICGGMAAKRSFGDYNGMDVE